MSKRREIEAAEYIAMCRRVLRAAGKRVGDADPEQLRDLVALRAEVDQVIRAAIKQQRANGMTWQLIGEQLGVTRQAALMHWGD